MKESPLNFSFFGFCWYLTDQSMIKTPCYFFFKFSIAELLNQFTLSTFVCHWDCLEISCNALSRVNSNDDKLNTYTAYVILTMACIFKWQWCHEGQVPCYTRMAVNSLIETKIEIIGGNYEKKIVPYSLQNMSAAWSAHQTTLHILPVTTWKPGTAREPP